MKWRPNPFVVAFVLGAAVLTVLPLLQQRFLRAPTPVMELPAWSLSTASGEAVGSASLRGRVYIASFMPAPCDEQCRARQEAFGRSLEHIDDLPERLTLVTFVEGETVPPSRPQWYQVGGPSVPAVFEAFRAGWARWAGTDAGTGPEEFAALPGFAVVDQNGALRGFWPDDAVGRGNAINGARLLAERGPNAGR